MEAYGNAKLAIEYRNDVREVFESLSHMPDQFRKLFIELLNEDPKAEATDLKRRVESSYGEWLNPYESDHINQKLNEARKFGDEAEADFRKVVDVLGDKADYESILEKLRATYESGSAPDADSVPKLLMKHGVATTPDLMRKLGVTLSISGRGYIDNGITYPSLLEALIAADKRVEPDKSLDRLLSSKEALDGVIGVSTGIETSTGDGNTGSEQGQSKGFFRKLADGDHGLAKTYWVYGVLVGIAFRMAMVFTAMSGSMGAVYLVVFASVAYSFPLLIGIWAASDKYEGPRFFSILAKLMAIIGWLSIFFGLFGFLSNL